MPGTGTLNKINATANINDYVEIVRDIHKDVVYNGLPNFAIATSLATKVIVSWANKYKYDFEGITLVAPSFRFCGAFKTTNFSIFFKLLKIYTTNDIRKREELVYSINSNQPIDQKNIDRFVDIQSKRPISRETFHNQIKASRNFKLDENFQLYSKVLVLGSKKDPLIFPSCVRKVANQFNVLLYMHEEAGHSIPTDALNWLLMKQSDWMRFDYSLDIKTVLASKYW